MKIKPLIAVVTPVGSPDRAESDCILGVILDDFWLVQVTIVVGEPLYDVGLRSCALNFTQGHLMKIDWLITDVTAVSPPDRVEHDILRMILDVFSANSGCYCGRGATL